MMIFDSGVKGLVLLALAGLVVTVAMRRSSPARRHLVWALALGGLLLLPLLSLVVPKWQLPILPRILRAEAPLPGHIPATPFPAPAPTRPSAIGSPAAPAPSASSRSAHAGADLFPELPLSAALFPRTFWPVVAWLLGALMTLLPLVAGLVAVKRLVRRARPFDGEEWPGLIRALAGALGLRSRVRLLCAGPDAMPMATGLVRAAILLPNQAQQWPEEKRRAVLLHELAHVRRRDCLTSALARLAVALHWFNPLAWVALRALRIERERACDDLVLTAGERPSVYADHLLDVARTLHVARLASGAAVSMARKSQLEGRLRSVLDASRNRKAVRRGALILGVLLVVAVAVALGALKVSEARVFSDMSPELKAEFDAWYTRKVSIPPEEVRVEPYNPALLQSVQRFLTVWKQHEETAAKLELLTKWPSPGDGLNAAVPDTDLLARNHDDLEKLEPLLAAYRDVVLHPDYTIDVWYGDTKSGGMPNADSASRWKSVRVASRLLYADALLQLKEGDIAETFETADALVASARVQPWSSTLDRGIAVAFLSSGVDTYQAIMDQPLDAQLTELVATSLRSWSPLLWRSAALFWTSPQHNLSTH